MSRPRSILFWSWILILVIGTAIPTVLAQPLRVPPAPQPATVEVEEGESVTIPLRAGTRTGYRLNFLIRSSPERGSIKEVRAIDDVSAEVVYQHERRNGGKADEFTYAVQGEGTAVSARAKVTILVRAPTSRVEYPYDVALGTIPAGLPYQAEIVFVNTGKAEAALSLKAPPWAKLDSDNLRVPASGEARAGLSVTPQGVGHLEGILEIAGDAKGGITLSAESISPVEVTPQSLKLGSGSAGTLNVRNLSNRALPVDFEVPRGIANVAPLTLKPDEAREVALNLSESAPASADDVVSVRTGTFITSIPITWSKAPAAVVFERAKSLDLGELSADRPARGNLVLRNNGEQKARVRLTTKDAWIVVPAESSAFDLAPGETKTISVGGMAEGADGERRGMVLAAWDSGTAEIPVRAVVAKRTAPAAPAKPPAAQPPSPAVHLDKKQPAPAMDQAEISRLVARERLKILSAESVPGKVHLKWQDPSPGPRTYRIEFKRPKPAGSVSRPVVPPGTKAPADQLLVANANAQTPPDVEDGRVVSVWREFPEAKLTPVGPQTTEAVLTGLGKSTLLSLRIIPIEANGRPGPVYTLLSIPLKPPPPPWWSWWQIRALAIAALLVLAGGLFLRGRAISQISS